MDTNDTLLAWDTGMPALLVMLRSAMLYASLHVYADGKHSAVSQLLRELRRTKDGTVPDG